MSLLRLAITLVFLEMASAPAVSSQSNPAVDSASAAQVLDPPAEGAPVSSGLPQRPPDPRTLHDYWPVFAGFAISWLGITAYLLSLTGKLKRLGEAALASTGRQRGSDVR